MMHSASKRVDESMPTTKTLTMIGFKVILSWHYLVLFSPIFIGAIDRASFPFLLERQLTLYITLALTFALLVGVGRFFLKRNKTAPSRILIGGAGILATIATALAVVTLNDGTPLRLASVVLLGFSEALLMFLWLHYYMEAAAGHLFRSFAVDMMAGGLIAFLTCSLVSPLNVIVALLMPGVATISLIANWSSVKPAMVDAPALSSGAYESGKEPSRKCIVRHSLKTLLPTTVYAFVFGLLQGSFIVSDVALLMAGNALVLVGIVLAGAIIFFIREAPSTNGDIDTIHRFSLLFFVLGVVGLSLFGSAGGGILIASEIVILAGFNLFDFGGMILGVGLARKLKPGSLLLVDGGRVLVYTSLALGLVVGTTAMTSMSGVGNTLVLYSLCGVAVIMLVATVLTPFREQETIEQQMARVTFDESVSVDSRKHPSTSACATKKEDVSLRVDAAGSMASKSLVSGVPASPDSKRAETPWRRTCQSIADLYKLSPRETEIFFLIAKGRNAEFVQQKLVISMHTAKTHIANIYHKLGVHSSQEMLSLIETFREEDIKSQSQS